MNIVAQELKAERTFQLKAYRSLAARVDAAIIRDQKAGGEGVAPDYLVAARDAAKRGLTNAENALVWA